MNKKKREKIITRIGVIGLIFFCIGITIAIIGAVLLDKEDKSDLAKVICMVGLVVSLLSFFPMFIPVMILETKMLARGIDMAFFKNHRNSAYLRIYASKNGRYCYNYLTGSKRDPSPHKTFDEIMFGDTTKYRDVEIYDSKYIDEKIDEAYDNVNVLDARKIDNVLFVEVELLNYTAYIYVGMNIKEYEIIILDKEDLKRRDEINNLKYNWFTINVRIRENFNEFFKNIENDNRDITKDIEEGKELEDVILEIKETLINGGYYE